MTVSPEMDVIGFSQDYTGITRAMFERLRPDFSNMDLLRITNMTDVGINAMFDLSTVLEEITNAMHNEGEDRGGASFNHDSTATLLTFLGREIDQIRGMIDIGTSAFQELNKRSGIDHLHMAIGEKDLPSPTGEHEAEVLPMPKPKHSSKKGGAA